MKKKRIYALGMLIVLILSMSTVAYADSSPRKLFVFNMAAYGGKDQSGYEIKEVDENYATVIFDENHYNLAYPPHYRVRAGRNDAAATGLVTGGTNWYVYYNAGYGNVGEQYYLKMQTDSSCPTGLYACGYWTP